MTTPMRIDQTFGPARAARIDVARPATLRDPSRAPVDVVIENLSETGALLLAEGDLPVGALVSLGIAGVGIQVARIARAEPGRFACEFMVPIDPAAVRVAQSADTLVSVAFPRMLPTEARAVPAVAVAPPVITEPAPVPVVSRHWLLIGCVVAVFVALLFALR